MGKRSKLELFESLYNRYCEDFRIRVVAENRKFNSYQFEIDIDTGNLILVNEDERVLTIIYCDPFWAYDQSEELHDIDYIQFEVDMESDGDLKQSKAYRFKKTFSFSYDIENYYAIVERFIKSEIAK